MKTKVAEFKENLPLIQCICNKGMRDRHWEQMSKIVEFSIKPDSVSFRAWYSCMVTCEWLRWPVNGPFFRAPFYSILSFSSHFPRERLRSRAV